MALTDKRGIDDDPYASFRFTATIQGEAVIGFSEVTGLTFETNVETFREGGVNTHEQQLAGPTKFPSRIILKRGLAKADVLWSWYQDVMSGLIERKHVTIRLLDYDGWVKWQWVFRSEEHTSELQS